MWQDIETKVNRISIDPDSETPDTFQGLEEKSAVALY